MYADNKSEVQMDFSQTGEAADPANGTAVVRGREAPTALCSSIPHCKEGQYWNGGLHALSFQKSHMSH